MAGAHAGKEGLTGPREHPKDRIKRYPVPLHGRRGVAGKNFQLQAPYMYLRISSQASTILQINIGPLVPALLRGQGRAAE